MKIQFTEEAWKDFEWFLDKDKRIVSRIRELLKDINRHPEKGIGKPERLRFQLSGC
jgi:toxin YoeB